METVPYVVKQGDYLTRLAFERGLSAGAVWEAPENASLRTARKNMDVLLPGDVIHFPSPFDIPPPGIEPGRVNSYVARVPVVGVRLRVHDSEGLPVANTDYELVGVGLRIKGKTDADGLVDAQATVFTREVQISFADKPFTLSVRIGNMDPPAEMAGVAKRLKNLGILYSMPDGFREMIPRYVIEAFQRKFQMTVTGELDELTIRGISEEYGV